MQFVRDPASDEIYTSPLSYGVAPFSTSLAKRTTRVELKSDVLVKPGQAVKMTLKTDAPARAFGQVVADGALDFVDRSVTVDDPVRLVLLGDFFGFLDIVSKV